MNGKIISIFSPRHDGATYFTLNLAASFKAHKQNVLIVDMNYESPDITYYFGKDDAGSIDNLKPIIIADALTPDTAKNYIYKDKILGNILYGTKYKHIELLPAENISSFFEVLRQVSDYIIIDIGSAMNDAGMEVINNSDISIGIVTPEIARLNDCDDMVSNLSIIPYIVVNRYGDNMTVDVDYIKKSFHNLKLLATLEDMGIDAINTVNTGQILYDTNKSVQAETDNIYNYLSNKLKAVV